MKMMATEEYVRKNGSSVPLHQALTDSCDHRASYQISEKKETEAWVYVARERPRKLTELAL
jgi:hypothetical protein